MIDIKLEKFEGPLGLLLKLIESEKMEIAEVSLAKIADQYISYIRKVENIDPEHMADFLVIAAKLLYIKSKALLPYLFPEEEEDIEELEEQLKMFKKFLEATKNIEERIKKKSFMFLPADRKASRAKVISSEVVFSPPKKLKREDLEKIFKEFIGQKKPQLRNMEEKILERKVSIEEKILAIEQALIEKIKFTFSEFLEKAESKTEVIVSFLAMLELIKQKNIIVSQDGLFEEILITKIQKENN